MPRFLHPVLLALLLAGCAEVFKGAPAAPGEAPGWKIRPAAIRIYPSTRFETDPQGAFLLAHVELLDAMGDSMKANGTLRFELHDHDPDRTPQRGERRYRWQIALESIGDHRQHFASVTRTYRFQLTLGGRPVPESPTHLTLTFTPPEGPRLEATRRLEPPKTDSEREP